MRGLKISRERFEVVNRDISDGSEPALRFYILVVVSTLIASFGLIANSTAVVIGAMLVAPLMTPIFGISLALVRGDSDLLGRAAPGVPIGIGNIPRRVLAPFAGIAPATDTVHGNCHGLMGLFAY